MSLHQTSPAETVTPLILQRADPHIMRAADGWYYFTASVPEYDRIELRRSRTIAGLATAHPWVVWRKPDLGPMCELIWAPELHCVSGRWCVYFAAAPSREILGGLFQHRIYVLGCDGPDPFTEDWTLMGRVETGIDSFCLDATSFKHRGFEYLLWAQKDPAIPGNSNLYLAPLASPAQLAAPAVRLSIPEYDWETRGFSVNEGPSVIIRHGRVWLSYSASATDENYCMGLLSAPDDAELMNPLVWTKSPTPVFQTCHEHGIYGPGHNSFAVAEDGATDLLVFHARTYTDIVGDPLWDPNRHTYVKRLRWDASGAPVFGRPSELG